MAMTNTFHAWGQGVTPKFPYEFLHQSLPNVGRKFSRNFMYQQEMRIWCEDKGWKLNEDFFVNAEFDKPWYFNSEDKQILFTLRWA